MQAGTWNVIKFNVNFCKKNMVKRTSSMSILKTSTEEAGISGFVCTDLYVVLISDTSLPRLLARL